MSTKELRFALDEKGLKSLAPTLVGRPMSYWDSDRRLLRGIVKSAEIARDRYGNPFITVEIEPESTSAGGGDSAPVTAAGGEEETSPSTA